MADSRHAANGACSSWGNGLSRNQPGECARTDFRQGCRLRGFRAGDERDLGKEAHADFGLPDHAQSLASCPVARARWRFGPVHTPLDDHARATLAFAPQDRWMRTSLSGDIQVLSGRNRRALAHGSWLCGAERPACGPGRASGGVAMVEPMAMAACGGYGRSAAVDGLARGATATMAAAGEPTATEGGIGDCANIGATWPSLRQRHMAGDDSREARARIDLPTPRKTQEMQIIGRIPFSSFLPFSSSFSSSALTNRRNSV